MPFTEAEFAIAEGYVPSGGGGGGVTGEKVYRALISQSGTAAPVVNAVLENSLGGTVVWTRSGTGFYVATLAGAFPLAKTFIMVGQVDITNMAFGYPSTPPDTIAVSTSALTTAAPVDGILYYTPVEIRVYP